MSREESERDGRGRLFASMGRGGSLARAGLHVPHVRQSFNWDCGLACTEMALRALGVPASQCSLAKLRQRVPSSSIWTVDLAFVL